MIKDIIINNKLIEIILQINSSNEKHLNEIETQIKKQLNENNAFNVNVVFQKPNTNSSKSLNSEQSLNSIPNVKNVIAIASGKGGVGKSTVSINLAASLSKNFKVGLLDLDIYGPSLPMLIGKFPQPNLTEDKKLIPIEKFNMKLMSFGFINSENAPAIWRGPMVSRMTQQFFEDVNWGTLDYLILDLPPGTGDIQLTLVQKLALTGAVIITTPQKLALLDVKKGADMFNKVNTPLLGVIENMTDFICPNCQTETEIYPGNGGLNESKRLNVPLLGKIPLDPQITISSDNGTPYVTNHQNSSITKTYNEIAKQIINITKT